MDQREYRMAPVEQAVFSLRGLYERCGYKKYKMSKFEEYALYLENKSFLPSPQVITFTDLGGKLLALKPDVTLSIAKNVPASPTAPEKVYYNENIYRTSRATRGFREIAQVGLELFGEVDLYSQCEVVSLACRSLELLSGGYIMTVSHMGFVSGLLEYCALPLALEAELLKLISHKNAHEITRACTGIDAEKTAVLAALATLHGSFAETLEKARRLVRNETMASALTALSEVFGALPPETAPNLTLDFSVINDLSYYNGLIFQGYIPKVPRAVLSGGRYDKLMEKLGKKTGAIGFAVYVDELEHSFDYEDGFDVDTVLLYGDSASAAAVSAAAERLMAQGKSVRVQKTFDGAPRCRQVLRLTESGGLENAD